MAEIKDLSPSSKSLSLLYVDSNDEILSSLVKILKQSFLRVDDASDATAGISNAKINNYDIIVLDSVSSIMSIAQQVENIKKINPYQEIIVTLKESSQDEIVELYEQDVTIVKKPFAISKLLDKILLLSEKISQTALLKENIKKLDEELLYERKRIGRFMLKERKLEEKIKLYENSIHINKNIYDLTKLPSRYALNEALNGDEQSLLYINIDNFDFVNTIYGMGKANKILKECAARLKMFLPKNAELYHITADEFVVLIDKPSLKQDSLLADQIHALFKEAPVEFDEYVQFIVFSIGIDKGEGKKLFVNAKSASKEARYFGGDKTVLFSKASDYMKEQRENFYWIGVLNRAFEEDKIFTYYQPIVNNQHPEIKHYEVLCRLMDDKDRLIDAKSFINSAKIVGLSTQITRTVIDKTFKLFKTNNFNFSINISMYDLYENYLVDFLKYKCEHYNVDPSRVYLELVEDIIGSTSLDVDLQVLELRNSGYHVIIDDFGSEKTMYGRIFDLKAELIKIDGSFIKQLAKDKSYKVIVKSIVEFSKENGIKTIAEHVESEEVYTVVKELGIDYAQGYLFGKPSLKLE